MTGDAVSGAGDTGTVIKAVVVAIAGDGRIRGIGVQTRERVISWVAIDCVTFEAAGVRSAIKRGIPVRVGAAGVAANAASGRTGVGAVVGQCGEHVGAGLILQGHSCTVVDRAPVAAGPVIDMSQRTLKGRTVSIISTTDVVTRAAALVFEEVVIVADFTDFFSTYRAMVGVVTSILTAGIGVVVTLVASQSIGIDRQAFGNRLVGVTDIIPRVPVTI